MVYFSIGDPLNLRVTFTDDLGGLYTRIRVIDFVAYDPAGGSSFYDIVKEGNFLLFVALVW